MFLCGRCYLLDQLVHGQSFIISDKVVQSIDDFLLTSVSATVRKMAWSLIPYTLISSQVSERSTANPAESLGSAYSPGLICAMCASPISITIPVTTLTAVSITTLILPLTDPSMPDMCWFFTCFFCVDYSRANGENHWATPKCILKTPFSQL